MHCDDESRPLNFRFQRFHAFVADGCSMDIDVSCPSRPRFRRRVLQHRGVRARPRVAREATTLVKGSQSRAQQRERDLRRRSTERIVPCPSSAARGIEPPGSLVPCRGIPLLRTSSECTALEIRTAVKTPLPLDCHAFISGATIANTVIHDEAHPNERTRSQSPKTKFSTNAEPTAEFTGSEIG